MTLPHVEAFPAVTLADRDRLLALLTDLAVGDRTTAEEAILLSRWVAVLSVEPHRPTYAGDARSRRARGTPQLVIRFWGE